MTHILAIDTSTDACSVAILTPSGVQQELSVSPREHTQRLLPSIELLLAEHELSLGQFDLIAFGVGPGSFTGLRIGLSTAQGLAYGADLPLMPISTLRAMAQTARRLSVVDASQTVVPAIDARMNEIYWSAYQFDSQTQQLVSLSQEMISAPDMLAKSELFAGSKPLVAIGSGWHYEQLHSSVSSMKTPALIEFYPEAYDIAELAQLDWSTAGGDEALISPLSAIPSYMRNEVSWKKRQRIRNKTA